LAAFMAQRKLSPAGFGDIVSANRSQIYRLLTGERGPSAGLAARIEAETGIRTAEWPPRRRKTRRSVVVRRVARKAARQSTNHSS
jgi:plasmid maintenance system antidote protein VapI